MNLLEWHDFDDEARVLELHESLTMPGPALELQIFRGREGHLVAFWVTANGDDLVVAEVGVA